MQRKIKCIHCKTDKFKKQGFRKTMNRGKIQKYKCLSCGKYFTNDGGFYRMRNSEEIITMSVDMYLSNLSSRKMRNQLRRHMKTKVSHVSVLDWTRKYILKVHAYVEKLNYENLGDSYYADETVIQCQRRNDNFWACVDWKTRMITGIHYSTKTEIKDAVQFLKKAVEKNKPKYIQTDAANFYPRAFMKAFYSNRIHDLKIEHKIQNYHETGIHNYKIEAVFMKIKDRVDDFRGLKALWSAPILMAGIVIQHNFIESHTTTGEVPTESAGQILGLGENRWLDLIRLSSC